MKKLLQSSVTFLGTFVRWAVPATALLVAASCGRQETISKGAHLVLPEGELGATATFEVRFDEPVARPDEVGKVAVESPLEIDPEVHGNFTWLSQRSGVFSPDEPLRLRTAYQVKLRAGLKGPDGQPLRARLRQTVRTPPFKVTAWSPRESRTNASSLPEVQLLFNARVSAAGAQPHATFRNAAGRSVAADVRQGTPQERPYSYMLAGSPWVGTWREQFFSLRPLTNAPAAPKPMPDEDETNRVGNLLMITPHHPLPVGQGWKLVLSKGVPSSEAVLRLPQSFEVPIGDVVPFIVTEAQVHNYVYTGKRVEVMFSKTLRSDATNLLHPWIELSPPVSDLTATVAGGTLTLRGDFQLNKPHLLTLKAGLPAEEPFTLGKPELIQFTVPPVAPRLYFPETATDQLAGGHREFQLLAVNVGKIRVRAKLLDPELAIHGLRGYASYVRPWEDAGHWDEPFRGLDYNVVPGRTVYDRELEGAKETDVAETITLRWDDLLGGRRSGVVFLAAERVSGENPRPPRLGTQAMIQLTDLGLVWKSSRQHETAFVFSHATGKPVPNASVRIVSAENETLGEARTDAQGLAGFPAQTNAHWLVARLGEDLHAVKLEEQNISLYSFDLPVEWRGEAANAHKILLFSDRGVYRPGETVHLKAIAREWGASGLTVPPGLAGSLKCLDARGRVFFETNVTFSARGSWNESVSLPQGGRGHYQAQLNVASNDYQLGFQVQDFQSSAFEVMLKAKPSVAAGEKVAVPVSARYYFGKDLSRAKVRWSLQAEDTEFRPEKFDGFTFEQAWVDGGRSHGSPHLSLQGEGRLTAGTNLVLAPELAANPVCPGPRTVDLLVEVTDLNQQTISKSAQFIRHSSDFYLGLKRPPNVTGAGEVVPVEVTAARADGKPWPAAVQAQLLLTRIEYHTVRVERAGRVRSYRSDPILSNIIEREVTVTPATLRRLNPMEEIMEGCRVENVAAPAAGTYLLEVRAKDAGGRDTIASIVFDVADKAQLAWNYRNEVQVDLVPDRKLYQPGQTAEILVKTPISGEALVTVEREKVLRSFVTRLSGNAPVVRVPMEAGDAPNVFICVMPVRGSDDSRKQFQSPEYRIGYCAVKVEDPCARLAVSVATVATNCLPGADVRVSVMVKDNTGLPAPNAEVTLWAVDEGVLSLTDSALPDPCNFFFEERRLAVFTGISLPHLMSEDPEQLQFHNKGYLIGDGAGRERLRKNFLPCAYWNATLLTGQDGRVEASFPAPDSLTRYRVIAVVHAGGSQFGRGQSSFAVSKPLMIEPALPRFANVSDHVQARAVVFNQTGEARNALVTLELDARARVAAGASLSRTIFMSARGSAVVEFPVEFTETGPAKWIWRARFSSPPTSTEAGSPSVGDPFTDSVQSTLEIGHIAPLLKEIHLARLEAAQTNLLAAANPQLLEGEGTVTVTVANTRLSELGEAAAHLLHYPYGCVEQTSSSLLPWIVLRDSPASRFLQKTPSEINRAIQAGVDRLLSMQTGGGGLGYWPRDREPMLWGSAYGGMVLALAARHGGAVPHESLDKLTGYLSSELRGLAGGDAGLSDRCLALYALALAGRAEPAYHETMFEKREMLSQEDRALLALSVLESQGPAAMADELLKPRPARASRPDDWFGCAARATAIRLLAWTHHRPADPIVDQLVADLMGGQQQAHWTTTQGNAWALLALTEYASRVETTLHAAEGSLAWGSQVVPFKLDKNAAVFEHTFALTPESVRLPLLLTNTTRSRLFTQLKLEARAKTALQPRQDRGFSLQRTYARLDDDNQPRDLEGLRVGDRVLVTLRLNTRQPAHYLAMDDALPSLFEAINPEFKTQQTKPGSAASPSDAWSDWFSNFRELRADRALFFANHLGAGSYVLHYLARVRAAGKVTAPSAKVEEMYHPERFGLTESVTIEAKPLE